MNWHKVLNKVGSGVFIAFITLVLLEGAVRVVDGRDVFTVRNWVTASLENRTETHSARYDPRLGWSGKPNLDIRGIKLDNPDIPDMSDVVVTTDANGYRSTGEPPASALQKDPVMTVGDSFTWGSEVSDHETYPAHLQTLIDTPVTNLAYGGWGTDQMWLRMQDAVALETPSLVLLSPLTNDVLRNAYRRYGRAFKPYFDLVDGKPVLRNVPVPRNSTRPEDIGHLQSWFGRLYLATYVARAIGKEEEWINRNRLNDRVHSNEKAVEIACALLVDVKEFSGEKGIPVVLAPVYSGAEIQQGKRHWFTDQYLDCARKTGLPVIDTFDAFVAASQKDADFPASRYRVWKNGAIAHMNSDGNLLVAETIAAGLREFGYIE